MRFCCEFFKSRYEGGKIFEEGKLVKEVYPNILIMRQEEGEKTNRSYSYVFLIVCGFLNDKPPVIFIAYCPFCGTNLSKFYKEDKYINQFDEDFLNRC